MVFIFILFECECGKAQLFRAFGEINELKAFVQVVYTVVMRGKCIELNVLNIGNLKRHALYRKIVVYRYENNF